MLADFEVRLANVLGSRLAPPFQGRVLRRGAPPPATVGPVIRVGIDGFVPLEPDFGSTRPEVVPGSDDQRRVVRLDVALGLDVEPTDAVDPIERLAGIDALIYELSDPEMRSASLLVEPGDQGFRLESLRVDESDLLVDSAVSATAVGWFWPIGQAGQTGRPIEQALIREFKLPMQLEIAAPLVAGGSSTGLALTFGATGTMEVAADGLTASPFGELALQLINDGGAPGAGTLTGGSAGPVGSHVVAVAANEAAVTYEPPGSAVVDHLIVSAFTEDADGEQRVGIELARFELAVAP